MNLRDPDYFNKEVDGKVSYHFDLSVDLLHFDMIKKLIKITLMLNQLM